MKLLRVWKDSQYLYIGTDEGDRKQSLSWKGVDLLEQKCRALLGREIKHSTYGAWSASVWFQDVEAVPTSLQSRTLCQPIGSTKCVDYISRVDVANRKILRVYGPPGTGKTSTLVRRAADALKSGVLPEKIGYFAFTNVAADEARMSISRLIDIDPSKLIYFSTLHSFTTKIGGHEGKHLCQEEHLKQFDMNIGSKIEWLKAGDPTSIVVRPVHPVLSAYTLMFNKKESKPTIDSGSENKVRLLMKGYFDAGMVNSTPLSELVEAYYAQYENFKRINNLADFNDVIKSVASPNFPEDSIPELDLLIVDEAQDLSALQWDVIAKLVNRSKNVIIAGDDDQAIMEPFGAAPDIFNQFPTTEPDLTLPISYRLPKNIKSFVDRTVLRLLRLRENRVEKLWSENPDAESDGEVVEEFYQQTRRPEQQIEEKSTFLLGLNDFIKIIVKERFSEWLIMAPTKMTCDSISCALKEHGVPHFLHRREVLEPTSLIQIQTIHTSKGMGSDNVGLVVISDTDRRMISEEARLEYVALTRAKQKLFVVRRAKSVCLGPDEMIGF